MLNSKMEKVNQLKFQTRTVQVEHLSELATEREIHEFFSFSGDIEHIQIQSASGELRTAFVTFKDPKALEIALLLSGATIVDQVVCISPVENYAPKIQLRELMTQENDISVKADANAPFSSVKTVSAPHKAGRVYVNKAQDVVTNILAKGSAIKSDALNKAKAFEEKHQLRAIASEKVVAFDRRVGLAEKWTVGISLVTNKVKSVDQKLNVSDKTMAALLAAERKLNDTGSAVKTSRYVSAGTSWLNGSFSKVAKAGKVAGTKTREKFNLAVSNLIS